MQRLEQGMQIPQVSSLKPIFLHVPDSHFVKVFIQCRARGNEYRHLRVTEIGIAAVVPLEPAQGAPEFEAV